MMREERKEGRRPTSWQRSLCVEALVRTNMLRHDISRDLVEILKLVSHRARQGAHHLRVLQSMAVKLPQRIVGE